MTTTMEDKLHLLHDRQLTVNAWEYGDNDPSDPEQNWDEDIYE